MTIQGQAGSWYLCRWKNIHRPVGLSGMRLFMGGQATHAASCMSPCMSHIMALAPQCVSIVAPSRKSLLVQIPEVNKARKMPKNYITWHSSAHASLLHVMGTVYQIQFQGYENTIYQVHSRLWEHCLPSLPRHLGEEARLAPLTLHVPCHLLLWMEPHPLPVPAWVLFSLCSNCLTPPVHAMTSHAHPPHYTPT